MSKNTEDKDIEKIRSLIITEDAGNITLAKSLAESQGYNYSSILQSVPTWDKDNFKFINTKYFSPIATGMESSLGLHPKSKAYKDFWDEQLNRILTGYTVGGVTITGSNYYYLNFCNVKGHGNNGYPFFTDLDKYFFDQVDLAKSMKRGLCVVKRRQVGFTMKQAALAAKELMFHRYSQTLISAGEGKLLDNIWNNMLLFINQLRVNSPFGKQTQGTESEYLITKYQKQGGREWYGYMSEVKKINFNDDDQAGVGHTPSLLIIDEAGKARRLKAFYDYMLPAMKRFGVLEGFPLIVGTGGEMEKGAEQLMELFYNPSLYHLMEYSNDWENSDRKIGYFIPATKFHIMDEYGNSLEDEALISLQEAREVIRKGGEESKLYREITQMPFIPSEAFMQSGASMFNRLRISEQIAFIKNHPSIEKEIKRYELDWKIEKDQNGIEKTREVRAIENIASPLKIYEHPESRDTEDEFDGLYIIGVDPYEKDEGVSDGAIVVFKRIHPSNTTVCHIPVAIYKGRPRTGIEFYELTYKIAVYYKAKSMFEYNNAAWKDYYTIHKLTHYLAKKPRFAYTDIDLNRNRTTQYGCPVTNVTKPYVIGLVADYIEDHCDKIMFIELLEELANYNTVDNFDLTMAFAMAMGYNQDLQDVKFGVKKERRVFNPIAFHRDYKGDIKVSTREDVLFKNIL